MKLKRRARSVPGESSASSDLAFLLIIYFLVVAGFNVNRGFLMNLPENDSVRAVPKDDYMRFEMDGRGVLMYMGEELRITDAEREIRAAAEGHPNLAVVLSIDGGAPWQRAVLFVELAQKLNIDSFSFRLKEEL